jgi:hypothetical protein
MTDNEPTCSDCYWARALRKTLGEKVSMLRCAKTDERARIFVVSVDAPACAKFDPVGKPEEPR